jgi:hypothetical protein
MIVHKNTPYRQFDIPIGLKSLQTCFQFIILTEKILFLMLITKHWPSFNEPFHTTYKKENTTLWHRCAEVLPLNFLTSLLVFTVLQMLCLEDCI